MEFNGMELNDQMDNIIVLEDEHGNPAEFTFLDSIDYEGKEYVVLLPVEQEEDGEVVILGVEPIEGSEDEESFVPVMDDDVLNAVFEVFKEKFKDLIEFSEEE